MAKPKAERSLRRALEAPLGVRALNLRGAPLRELPPGLSALVDLEHLDLSQTSLTRVGGELGSLSKLVTLSLSEAYSLKVLGPEIGELHALVELDLFGTRMEALPDRLFELPHLESLNLGATVALRIPPLGLSKLSKLHTLSLYGHATIPDDVLAMPCLRNLSLGDEALAEVPEALGDATELVSLSLGGGTFTRLPESVARLQKLTSLEPGRCSALDLEQAFPLLAQLPKLERLGLSGSVPMKQWFRRIPAGLGKLGALKRLDLSGNQLRELPDDVFTLPKLEQLDLSQNVLRALPPNIGELAKLKELSLSFNRANPYIEGSSSVDLENLFANASRLIALRTLDMRWMSLASIPSFAEFPNLRVLKLGNEVPEAARAEVAASIPKLRVE